MGKIKKKKKEEKRFKQTLRIEGQGGDIIHLTENKCLFYELKNKL